MGTPSGNPWSNLWRNRSSTAEFFHAVQDSSRETLPPGDALPSEELKEIFKYPHLMYNSQIVVRELSRHPIHCLFGWIASEKKGLKVDLTAFKTSKDFLQSISIATLAKIIFVFVAAGLIF